jgi:hypothetical protein
VEVLIEVTKDYPFRPPFFKLKNIPKHKQKFPSLPSATIPKAATPKVPLALLATSGATGSQVSAVTSQSVTFPPHITSKCDQQALNLVTTLNKEKSFDINLKTIEIELNTNYDELLNEDTDPNQLLTLQLAKLKICLDINFEVEKRGRDSPIAKVFGRPHSGRDRRKPFAQQLWKTLQ